MKRLATTLALMATIVLFIGSGCAQTPPPAPTKAPAPAAAPAQPTKAPAAPTQPSAAAPTKAPAVQPTAAPAPKVTYPEKGRSITLIVPWSAGGAADTSARVVAAAMEQELGTSIQVLNKAGAGSQIGITEFVKSKPDGYTLGFVTLGNTNQTYLVPDRGATFTRKDFQLIAAQDWDTPGLAVKADGPYKSVKDMVDAAKAAPEKVKLGNTGLLSSDHIVIQMMEKATGAKFATVVFDGGTPGIAAVLGGHVDGHWNSSTGLVPRHKSGEIRIIALADSKRMTFVPEVPTLADQGLKIYYNVARGWAAPAGTPPEIREIIRSALKRALEQNDVKERMEKIGIERRFTDTAEYEKLWSDLDETLKPIIADYQATAK